MWRLPLSRRFGLRPRTPSVVKAPGHSPVVMTGLTRVAAVVWLAGSLAGCGAALNSDAATGFPAQSQNQSEIAIATTGVPYRPAAAGVVTGATGAANVGVETPSTKAGTAKGTKAPASAAKAAEQLTASATPGSNAYKIGALDVLDISVFKVPEMSKSVQVADSGTANFPLVGDIQVVGRTAQQVERDLAAKLGAKYLQNPQVTVFVKEYNSQRVTIEGAVKKPGVFPIRGQGSLMQFIAMAEGLDQAAGTEVVIFRQTNGKRVAGRFDIGQIKSGEAADPPLQSGDVIVVQSSMMKETFNNFVKILPLMGVFAAVL